MSTPPHCLAPHRPDSQAEGMGGRVGVRAPDTPTIHGTAAAFEGDIPAAEVHGLQQQLSGLTRGEGVLETRVDHYQPVSGAYPTRAGSR
jgi:translation elongation factor EF-G